MARQDAKLAKGIFFFGFLGVLRGLARALFVSSAI
jgi:hypothetical protein